MINILVLGGGNSDERDVSLRSANEVAAALKVLDYKVHQADPKDGLSVLDVLDDLDELDSQTIIFPILHGKGGEDGVIQHELEARQLPYLGTPSAESAVCFDKFQTREALKAAGFPVARGQIVDKMSYRECDLSQKPHVLKVTTGGSSIGTYMVHDPLKSNDAKIDEIFLMDAPVLIEELIEGVEITVPILDNQSLPVIEIQPPAGNEFDYENKYNGATAELCPPVSINIKTQKEAQVLSLKIHRQLGCRHLSRVDIIVRPSGELVVLEINTLPGMTSQSLYPKSAQVAGFEFPALVKQFAEMVARDYQLDH